MILLVEFVFIIVFTFLTIILIDFHLMCYMFNLLEMLFFYHFEFLFIFLIEFSTF